MTAFAPRELAFANESTFGDSTATSMTYRIPVISIEPTDDWARLADESIHARMNASSAPVLGPRRAGLKFTCYVPGGNGVPSSALSTSWFTTLLANAIGTQSALGVQQLVGVGSDADTIVSASSSIGAGAMFAVGVRGTRAGGRFAISSSVTAGLTIQSLVALPGVAIAGDQIWDAVNIYPTETPTTSQRFLVQWGATGSAYYFHGGVCTDIEFNIPIGGLATCTFTYVGAVVTGPSTVGLPAVAALSDCLHVPTMNGLCFFQAHATTTHATKCPTEITLKLDLGTALKETICGPGQYQTITGWERTKCVPMLTLKEYWDGTGNTSYALDGASTAYKHFLFQNSADATGKRWGFYMPRMYQVAPTPMVEDVGGLMAQTTQWIGTENVSPETTTDIMKSAIRFAFA